MPEATHTDDALFDVFASFRRLPEGNPVFYCEPPEWAAAAHAIVLEDQVHYLWGRRKEGNFWVLMHSTAPTGNPADVTHDDRNPVLTPAAEGFDDYTTEYPFPFHNPADDRLYAYYLGRRLRPPKQTGLLVSTGDPGQWRRFVQDPVLAADTPCERLGSSHPSVAIADDTIHILYTGESSGPPVICHATAPLSRPEAATKDPGNPVFSGSGAEWDSQGVREAEIYRGPEWFHILYGGSDGTRWQVGHVRTRDFREFEANPANPVFSTGAPGEWDSDGVLTPQVFQSAGSYYMLYAGQHGKEWQSGLARAV